MSDLYGMGFKKDPGDGRRPPAGALWLLAHAGGSLHAESLAGDLAEEFNRGRSAQWVWRQVLIAVLQRLAPPRLLKRLLRVLAVITLGAGTLTWASTARHEACGITPCAAPVAGTVPVEGSVRGARSAP